MTVLKTQALRDCAYEQSRLCEPTNGGEGNTIEIEDYRCVTTSLSGFVQQIATAYIPHGYWFYVQGYIPDGKEPDRVDRKLIATYGIAISKWQRTRRKKAGHANMQYIRYAQCFILMATKGKHLFFDREANNIRDLRKTPIKISGYSISARRGSDHKLHTHVRIDQAAYNELRNRLIHTAENQPNQLAELLGTLPYQPYAPIRRQYLAILRQLRSGVRMYRIALSSECLPLRRRIVAPFAEPDRDFTIR